MIYKFNNGGIVKLQDAGNVPNLTPQQQKMRDELDQILAYNREHGTNFYKMEQVLEYDKQQAQKKSQNKKSFWEILAGHPESAGEAILNKAIETANNAELPETRSKIYNDTGKAQLAITTGSLLTLPMLGEFSTYGLLGGFARLAGGFGGSAVGSYALGKAGELGDKQFGTTWMKPAGQIIGGFAGWVPGSNITYKGALDLASSAPRIARIGVTDRFIGDVGGRVLGKSVKNTSFIPSELTENKVISFTPIQQKPVSTVHFDHRIKPLNKFGVRTDYEFDPRYKGLSTYDRNKLMFDDFLSGRKLASDFFNSEIKRSTDAFNKKLAESLGYNFVENKDAVARIEKPMIKTEDGYWIQRDGYGGFYLNPELAKKHSLGQYRPGHDDIILTGLGDIENISMHEHLHRGKFGEAPRTNIQKFGDREKWDSTDAFYQKLTDDIVDSFKPFDEYLSTPGEAATNLLETGRRAGIKIGQEYPGNEKAIEIFKEIIANDSQKGYILNYFKWKDEPEKVWKALTGRYYTIPLLGLGLYGTNK